MFTHQQDTYAPLLTIVYSLFHYSHYATFQRGTNCPFQLDGEDFLALNGGPAFTFSEAISFIINCENQLEIDMFWEKLSEGGQIQQCGWLKDKFGVSWQIVPIALNEMLQSDDSEKSNRVMQTVMQMIKLDIEKLESVYHG